MNPIPKDLILELYKIHLDNRNNVYCPVMLLLQSELAQSTDYTFRLSILHDVCENHMEYLRPLDIPQSELASFYLDCKSLIHYNEIIAKLMEKVENRVLVKENLRNYSLPKLEQYIYMQNLLNLDLSHYVAFIEGCGLYTNKKSEDQEKTIPILSMAILQTWNCLSKLFSDDIIAFCKHLYIGESMRLHETGQIQDGECMDIHTFPIKLRNTCFEEYIRLRQTKIKEDLLNDNDRLFESTEIDCLQELLEQESAIVEREIILEEHFPDSQAFQEQNYQGRHDVLKMAGYFVAYLQDKINKLKSTINTMPTQHITFNGPTTYTDIHDNKNINIR